MRFAVFTACLPEYTPDDAVTTLSELGYAGIEWRVTDQRPSADGTPGFWAGNRCTWPEATFLEDAPRIRTLTESAGLVMPALGTYASCENLERVDRVMRGAAILGVPQLRINVPKYDGSTGYLRLRDRALAQYREVAALAREHSLRALVEIHHGSLLPSASAAAAFLVNFDPHHVGAIHDAGNMVYEGHEHYRLGLEVLGPYLAHVHLKNTRWETVGTHADGSVEWRARGAPIRAGIVDMTALFRALRQVGYDGWISFEDFSTEQPLAQRLRDNLTYISQVAQATAE